ncbi:MAG TPA: DUF2249 domain-containing protein [Chitinophagaceae bacterium]|nr:DUF2249 domain-containing protein [Chitinophagaceae bacterium]
MIINANTKIGSIIKEQPAALEAIVSISPKFEKLRNPVLRKLIAGRASIAMASKIGGCSVDDFFKKLEPLGFTIDKTKVEQPEMDERPAPDVFRNLKPGQIVKLDVRPVIEAGKDPLDRILVEIKKLQPGQALVIINTFKPEPLILLLGKQGFLSHTEVINDNLVQTYFIKEHDKKEEDIPNTENQKTGWEEVLSKYNGKIMVRDVRQMEMPLPMMTILEALDNLPDGGALYVYHKRIPVFLLPELKERNFDYRIKEICDGEVHLLIFKS